MNGLINDIGEIVEIANFSETCKSDSVFFDIPLVPNHVSTFVLTSLKLAGVLGLI